MNLKHRKKYIGMILCGVLLCHTVLLPPIVANASVLTNVAAGITVYSNEKAAIDASNAKDGYIMVAYTGGQSGRVKVRLTGPSGTDYNYDLNNKGTYEAFGLSDGAGKYTVKVFEQTSGNRYATAYSTTVDIVLVNEFAPYLRPNKYVSFTADSQAVKKAAELVKGKKSDLEKITAIYDYTVGHITYDTEKANSVASGYIPNVDNVMSTKKGICFDYAALMAAMLRSQGIPTKLVVGYTGDVYHAWITTYIPETGWVEGIIFFDGTTWKLMDPTFAASAKSNSKIMEYIGDGSNYQEKYNY